MAKKFKDLDVEGFIYRINPFTTKVEGLKIRDITGVSTLLKGKHPNPEIGKHYVQIVCYMPDAFVHSPDLNNIPTIKFILDGRLEAQMTIQKALTSDAGSNEVKVDLPIPVAAERKTLEEWMRNTG